MTQNAWNSNIPVEISKGGTNATSMSTSSGIVKYDGTSLVTSTTALIDASNRYTNTSQPAFLAYVNTTITDVTGDGTTYTVIFDVESFDQGSNFNLGTSTFTAPVAGLYLFTFNLLLVGGTTISAGNIRITTTSTTFNNSISRTVSNAATSARCSISSIASMAVNDTAIFTIQSTDGSGKVDDVSGLVGGEVVTFVSGCLLC